jgi:hypothetical protein
LDQVRRQLDPLAQLARAGLQQQRLGPRVLHGEAGLREDIQAGMVDSLDLFIG